MRPARRTCQAGVFAVLVVLQACSEPTGTRPETPEEQPSFDAAQIPEDYVSTPGGWYHRSCVHAIEDGAVVGKNGLVRRRNGQTYQLPMCKYPKREETHGALAPTLDGWIEWTSRLQPSGSSYQRIAANWTVPIAPIAPYTSPQNYYTFPGLQSSSFIIQPVLQYGFSPAGGGQRWGIASWHCDTGPGCTHSSLVTVSAGHVITGTAAASSCSGGNCTWTITSRDATSGQQTTLTVVDVANYFFASGGAVEVHGLTSCDQFPINGVGFSSIALFDQNGSQLTPSWAPNLQPNVSPACSFAVASTATTVNLSHNPQSVTASGPGLIASVSCGLCTPDPQITSITASGSVITMRDDGGHTGTITLSGATAAGGLTASSNCITCTPDPQIVSVTASGTNIITLRDNGGHSGNITLTGAVASGGLTASSNCITCTPDPQIVSVTATGANAIFLTDNGGHSGYVRLSH